MNTNIKGGDDPEGEWGETIQESTRSPPRLERQNAYRDVNEPGSRLERRRSGITEEHANEIKNKINPHNQRDVGHLNDELKQKLEDARALSSQLNRKTGIFNKVFGIYTVTYGFILIILCLIVIIALAVTVSQSNMAAFNNRVDAYGSGLRYNIERDDSGFSASNNLYKRSGYQPLIIEPLTSNPEPPTISEQYGIEANLKDGKVMIERENFENSALSLNDLEKANKGF